MISSEAVTPGSAAVQQLLIHKQAAAITAPTPPVTQVRRQFALYSSMSTFFFFPHHCFLLTGRDSGKTATSCYQPARYTRHRARIPAIP